MAGQKRLVLEHLESVSWRVLDEYSDVIRQIIRGRAGVYGLYRKGKLYYVGLAKNLMQRLQMHLKDRHHGAWDRFSIYVTVRSEHIKELESLILRISKPTGNKTGGKFIRSESLRSSLNRRMSEVDADRRAMIIGGSLARRRRRSKAKKGRGTKGLAGIVDRRMQLKGTYLGKEYKASLRTDGRIGCKGEVFDSPSGAAKAATGRGFNGWSFWHYRNEKGNWVRLRELRR